MGVKLEVSGAKYIFNENGVDSPAITYLTNSGIVDTTEVNAIKDFSRTLIYNGLFAKMKGLWMFVGDDYNNVKYNLIDDSLYTLPTIPSGNISDGLLMSTLGGINTGFTGDASFIQSSHLAFYNSTQETNPTTIILHDVAASNALSGISATRVLSNKTWFGVAGSVGFTSTSKTERGLFVGVQDNSIGKIYSRGVLLGQDAKVNTGTSTSPLTIGTSTVYKSSTTLQLASVGDALTAEEVVIYNTACEQLMTDLGR